MRTSATLSYNVFGKRIQAIGIQGLGDVYEMPVNTLNLVVKNEWSNGLSVKVSAKNLLNQYSRIVQETSTDPVELNAFQRGISFGVGVGYKF